MIGEASVFTDGGSRGNPGHAGIGVLIKIDNKVVCEHGDYIGQTTNNIAEYQAFFYSLNWLCEHQAGIKKVVWQLDSLLVVKQLNGEWRVKDKNILLLVNQIKQILKTTGFSYRIVHIPREENALADALVNQALDRFLQSS